MVYAIYYNLLSFLIVFFLKILKETDNSLLCNHFLQRLQWLYNKSWQLILKDLCIVKKNKEQIHDEKKQRKYDKEYKIQAVKLSK